MSYESLQESLKQFKAYLALEAAESNLAAYLRKHKANPLHLTPIGNEEMKQSLINLLKQLEIDPGIWNLDDDPKLTVYQYLQKLHEKICLDKIGAESGVAAHLQKYKRNDAIEDFHLIPIGNKGIRPPLIALFKELKIHPGIWYLYYDPELTVYQFLKKLHKKTRSQELKFVLDKIDAQVARSKSQLILTGLFFIACALTAYFVPPLHALFTTAMSLTVGGLVYTGITALLKLRQNMFRMKVEHPDDKIRDDKIREIVFLATSTLLNFAAYGLWISAQVVMSPLIAGLFIGASAVEVCKELFIGFKNYNRYKNKLKELPGPDVSYHRDIDSARANLEFKKHCHAALINLTAAVLLVGLIAAWCFLPSTVLTTLSIVTTIVVVHAAKSFFNKCNNARNKVQLDRTLESIHLQYEKGPGGTVKPRRDNAPPTCNAAASAAHYHPPLFSKPAGVSSSSAALRAAP